MNLEVSHKELSQPNSTPTDLHQEDQNSVPLYHGLYDSQENGSPKTAQAFLLYRNQAQRANKNDFSIKNEKNDQNIENPQIGKNLPREQIDDASSPSKSLHGFESFGKQYHGGSLDNLYNEAKKELNKALPPTFGDDQFNVMVNQQIIESPMNSQEKPGKIERMLQEHKKKKILQKIFAVKKEEQPSPRLGLDSSAKSSSKLSYDMLQRELVMSISEGEFRNLEPEPTFGTRSHPKLEGVNQYVDYPESQNSPDNDHDIVYNYESTGRFGGHFVPYGYEFNDDDIESYNKDNENRSLNNERPQFERKSSGTSSKRISGNSSPKGKSPKNIPKISENSQRIMKNSLRNKEDEEIIQELVSVNALKASKKMASPDGNNLLQLQNIPEENEDYYQHEKNTLGAKAKITVQQKLQKLHGNNITKESNDSVNNSNSFTQSPMNKSSKRGTNKASPNEGRIILKATLNSPDRATPNKKGPGKQNLDSSKGQILNDSQNTSANRGRNTPLSQKKSPVRKVQQDVDVNDVSTNPSLYSSPQKNIPSATIIEHKKRSHLEIIKAASRLRKGRVSVSPTQKEIKELANMAKSIYLRVVKSDKHESEIDSTPKSKSSFKKSVQKAIKNHPIVQTSEFFKKLAERPQKIDLSFLTPEELKAYDEVQRLEIMLQNLRQIQQANLMIAERSTTNNSPKNLPKQDWNHYASNINGDVQERRLTRKRKEEEKMTRFKSLSPTPMEKIDPTLESLIESVQIRQKMFPRQENEGDFDIFNGIFQTQDGQIKSWEDMDMYERNIVWLLARNDKLQKMSNARLEDEMRSCSFKPTIYTKNFHSAIQSAKLNADSPYVFNTLSDRLPIERENLEGDENETEKINYLKDRSLYKERRSIENYTDLFGLKKTYNLYKSEIFLPKRADSVSAKIEKSDEDLKSIPTEI